MVQNRRKFRKMGRPCLVVGAKCALKHFIGGFECEFGHNGKRIFTELSFFYLS
jgi:hypothetical protein